MKCALCHPLSEKFILLNVKDVLHHVKENGLEEKCDNFVSNILKFTFVVSSNWWKRGVILLRIQYL